MPKSERLWHLFVEDIAQAADKIISYVQNMSEQDFLRDGKTIDAVIRNLEIIGEAVKHIPHIQRKQYSHIQWRKIAGLRDIIVHDYFGLNMAIIWNVIDQEVPQLQTDIALILQDLRNKENQ